MRGTWGCRWSAGASLAAALLLLLGALPAGAQAPVPVGPEFQVNTYTTSYQHFPSVAAGADGNFVVVWQSFGSSGTDTSSYSIKGQRYASNGSALGSEFQVNTYTTTYQTDPSVAASSSGDFVVVWESSGSSGTDTSSFSIQGQRFASNGSALGSEFQVNTYTTSYQTNPFVAANANGDFVVVWQSFGSSGTDTDGFSIQGQRFASNGSALGGQFQVNTYATSFQQVPSVTMDTVSDFVVVWQSVGSSGTDTSSSSIQGQRFASNGSALGGEFQVNTYTTSYQYNPSAAASTNGDFVVVWQSLGSSGTDTNGFSIQGQRFASNGSALGSEFQVNTYTPSFQQIPSVKMDTVSDFVVVWQSVGSSGTDTSSSSIQGQLFASNGSALGGEFQVNTYTTGNQYGPSVTTDTVGDFVVVWQSLGSSGTDTSNFSIHGQRYLPEPGSAVGLAAGLGLLFALRSLDRGGALALREEWNRAAERIRVSVKMYEGAKHAFATDAAAQGPVGTDSEVPRAR